MKQNIWVFDIDGVITDPKTKTITQPQILDIICNRLISGEMIAFNTGRSAVWLGRNVVDPLTKLINFKQQNPSSLTNLVSICEMGNVTIEYKPSGQTHKTIFNKNVIPPILSKALTEIVNTVYNQSMFVDETKEVIFTIEMRDDFSHEQYEIRQEEFQKEINIIMKHYHPNLHVKPSSTTIAIDVKPIDSGKKLGTARILDYHKTKEVDINNSKYICFGDSPSDLDMSDYLALKGIDTELVFVGDDVIDQKNYPTHKTNNKYTKGTLEYLKKITYNPLG